MTICGTLWTMQSVCFDRLLANSQWTAWPWPFQFSHSISFYLNCLTIRDQSRREISPICHLLRVSLAALSSCWPKHCQTNCELPVCWHLEDASCSPLALTNQPSATSTAVLQFHCLLRNRRKFRDHLLHSPSNCNTHLLQLSFLRPATKHNSHILFRWPLRKHSRFRLVLTCSWNLPMPSIDPVQRSVRPCQRAAFRPFDLLQAQK